MKISLKNKKRIQEQKTYQAREVKMAKRMTSCKNSSSVPMSCFAEFKPPLSAQPSDQVEPKG